MHPSPPDTREEGSFDRGNVVYLSGAHFIHDCYPAFIGVLLPILIPRLGLSLTAAGILASSMRWTTSLQPFLGYWADRRDTRYWVILAPTTTAVCMSVAGLSPNVGVLLVLLLSTGVSHAAFHPAAGALVTRISGPSWGKGMSYFMTGGELGRVIGPLAIAAMIGFVGIEQSWIIVIPGILASFILYRRFRHADFATAGSRPPRMRGVLNEGRTPLLLMAIIIILRSFMIVGFLVFYPTFATGLGSTLLIAGLGLTIYELGGTIGAFVGGLLSDRIGRVRTMVIGLLFAVPMLLAAVAMGPTLAGIAFIGLGGLGLLSSQAVELVVMQQLLPEHRSSAVGITYLLKAIGGTAATILIGAAGDVMGIQNALFISVTVGLVALPVLYMMRPHDDIRAATSPSTG
ncbi:MAG: MFS transporter [Nitriliruptoraceae bacterium]